MYSVVPPPADSRVEIPLTVPCDACKMPRLSLIAPMASNVRNDSTGEVEVSISKHVDLVDSFCIVCSYCGDANSIMTFIADSTEVKKRHIDGD